MKNIICQIQQFGAEHVLPLADEASHLRGWMVIDSTRRGPAFGGIRYRAYEDESEALHDALSLARTMTWKTALAELPCGGGKIVLMARDNFDRERGFRWLGTVLEALDGRFYAGPDLGVDEQDLHHIRRETSYVGCGLGDVSYGMWTARGVLHALAVALTEVYGDPIPWSRLRVVVQGLGHVGWAVARELAKHGCRLLVGDIDAKKVRQACNDFKAQAIAPDQMLDFEADVLVPCALGGVLTPAVARHLRYRVVCGSANNILAHPDVAFLLQEREILMIPDFLSSAGAVIAGALEYFEQASPDRIEAEIERIRERTTRLLNEAKSRNKPPTCVAIEWAEQNLRMALSSDA